MMFCTVAITYIFRSLVFPRIMVVLNIYIIRYGIAVLNVCAFTSILNPTCMNHFILMVAAYCLRVMNMTQSFTLSSISDSICTILEYSSFQSF